MALSPLDPVTATALAAAAAYLMTTAGLGKKLLRRRVPTCPVCHRPGHSCTCRWL
jgi:hypothetical protein